MKSGCVCGRCNQRSWLYRIRPSVTHEPFHPLDFASEVFSGDFERALVTPNQLRWRPFSVPTDLVDFVRGLFTVCGAGRRAPASWLLGVLHLKSKPFCRLSLTSTLSKPNQIQLTD